MNNNENLVSNRVSLILLTQISSDFLSNHDKSYRKSYKNRFACMKSCKMYKKKVQHLTAGMHARIYAYFVRSHKQGQCGYIFRGVQFCKWNS
mgnify:CR=1 FL=1